MSSHEAILEFDYESPTHASIIAESVSREIDEIDDERSQTTIARDGRVVEIRIDAADVIALRAALNTWFTLVDVAERTAAIADDTRRQP